jgi:hypothetical protein
VASVVVVMTKKVKPPPPLTPMPAKTPLRPLKEH